MTLGLEEYKNFHPHVLQPLDIKIDIELFEEQMHEYRYAFRRWGEKHTEYPRYGAPLVNLNGDMFNNPEPICYPLDQWNEGKSEEEKIRDPKCTTPTPMLSESCFDPLAPIKPFMYRSAILKWHNSGHFKPHTDTKVPSDIIRLWGTNDPDNMIFQFDKDRRTGSPKEVARGEHSYELVRETDIEPGRLYITDTHVIHDASATADNVYQFFISLSTDSMPTLKELLL
jgi:hypothetical protein